MKNTMELVANITWTVFIFCVGILGYCGYSSTATAPILIYWLLGGSVVLGMLATQIHNSMGGAPGYGAPPAGRAGSGYVEYRPPPPPPLVNQHIPEILEEIEEQYPDGSKRRARRVLKGKEAIAHAGNNQIGQGRRPVQNERAQKRRGAGGRVRYLNP